MLDPEVSPADVRPAIRGSARADAATPAASAMIANLYMSPSPLWFAWRQYLLARLVDGWGGGSEIVRRDWACPLRKPTDTKTSRCLVMAADASAPPFPDGYQSYWLRRVISAGAGASDYFDGRPAPGLNETWGQSDQGRPS
jgi:hypothetical protein